FDGIQLGPMGMTSRGNNSPYDSTLFSRNPLDLPFKRFFDEGRIGRRAWDAISARSEGKGKTYSEIYAACQGAIGEVAVHASRTDREAAREFLEVHQRWLIPDALYDPLCREHGSESWLEWNSTAQGEFDQRLFDRPTGESDATEVRLAELKERYASSIEDYALIQWLLAEEHRALRVRLRALGLSVYGDLQVGLSQRDHWANRRLLLPGYLMGAPPSRTNPIGQPWGYPVLDPMQFGTPEEPGPALLFVRERIQRLLGECDGVRIDHPHGWVDPWVYRGDQSDPFLAVQSGARLYSSPDNVAHPELARWANVRPDQIDRAQTLHADGYVKALDDEQVRKYSQQIDVIANQLPPGARVPEFVACEVLSTLPYPVKRVIERHGIGRFRVTQKLNLSDASDVYRIENSAPADWIMLGTHDTPSIWELAGKWCQCPEGTAWGNYLSELLGGGSGNLPGEIAKDAFHLVNGC
ncbi:MAG: 4-alpha-glucanotransferase, partial [Planctomycetaceae bacterium]|nr:4-alpha-glucanotransferase [Planctomycetaceae bacterium]